VVQTDALLSAAPALVWSTDRDLRVLEIAGGELAHLGPSAGRLVGRTVLDYFADFGIADPRFPPIAAHVRALEGESVTLEQTWLNRSFHARIEPRRDGDGAVIGCVGAALSVEDRLHAQQLAESDEMHWVLAQSARDGILTIDEDGRVLLANPALTAILGHRPEDLVGRELSALVPAELRDAHREGFRRYLATGERRRDWGQIELPGLHRDGRLVPLEISFGEYRRDGRRRFVAVLRDVTERKESERRHAAQDEALSILAESPSLDVAGPLLLSLLGDRLEWDLGAIWALGPQGGALACAALWHDDPALARFASERKGSVLRRGEGLPGQVLDERESIWLTDAADEPDLPGAAEMVGAGLHGALWVPLRHDGTTVGVIELLARRRRAVDREGLGVVEAVAEPLARFLEQQRRQRTLRASEEEYRLLFERNLAGVFRKTVEGRIVACNEAFVRLLGYASREELEERSFVDLYADARERHVFFQRLERERALTNHEIRLKRADGTVFWALENATLLDRDGERFVEGTVIDINDRKTAEESLTHLAYHDVLTGLPNRALFLDRLRLALSSAHRHGHGLAVLFLDLDSFKAVNDRFGHHVGDALLREVAERLRACARAGDTVSRFGGDEFATLLVGVDEPEDAAFVARKMLRALARPLDLGDRTLEVFASLGASLFPGDGVDADGLVKSADRAMYRAKGRGPGRFELAGGVPVLPRPAGGRSLADAIALDEFAFLFEPEIDSRSGRIAGLEAQVRWRHPSGAIVPLTEILPLAEETQLVVPIGTWSLWNLARQGRFWHLEQPALELSLPFPGGFLKHPQLLRLVDRVLERTGLDAGRLAVQIAERVPADLGERLPSILRALKERGLRIVVDGLWTGHAPLDALAALPIDGVKLDFSLLGDAAARTSEESRLRDLVRTAHGRGLRVVARGLGSEAALAFARDAGCDALQGPAACPGVPLEETRELFRGWAASRERRQVGW